MKKYLVLKTYNSVTPTVVYMTDIEADAIQLAEIYSRNEDTNYKVAVAFPE